ncbi:MAG: hypothetical protein H7Z16_19500 [Pyrinomonadaceae bacterium]|nr:hypothetical protein [Pyrinomonadaceae bacterium]
MNRGARNRQLHAIARVMCGVDNLREPIARAWLKLIARCLYGLEMQAKGRGGR